MLRKYTYLFLLVLFIHQKGKSQDAYIITGKIFDASNKESVAGATVGIKGTTVGTIAGTDGTFTLKTPLKLPFTLIITSIGYDPQEFVISDGTKNNISISLNPQQLLINQVVVSASRVPENMLKSPVSIEKLDIRAIKQSAAPSFFDALENLKGVQMTTLSLGYKVPNTRGFSGTTNSRFLQMVDGVDNISPGIGAPVANAVGPNELDIESVELIPGAASALYGLNAINGISNMKTKSPFKYQGFSVYQKTGVNHVNDASHSPAPLTETAFRYAKAFNNKIAFKVNFSYFKGYDWIPTNLRDQNATANTSVYLTGADNPGKDLINRYGDESSDRKTLTLNGKNYIVSRTGYEEKDLADYNLQNTKFDAAVHYKVYKNNELSYTYRTGNVSNLYQRGNRIQLDGLQIQQHVLEFKGDRFFIKGYYTGEKTGNSYNLRPLGENIDLAFKGNTQWFNDYKTGYLNAVTNGSNEANAHIAARTLADKGRYLPGTEAFNQKKAELVKINNWDKGAALIMNTAFVHTEGQYDLSDYTGSFKTLIGFNYRNYIIQPDGNSYVNPASYTDIGKTNTAFNYYSYGSFAQLTKTVLNDKLKLVGSIRIDKTQYFDPKLNPRIAGVYTIARSHNFRASYQNGYRFPTLFEGFSYVDNGGVKRLGGLRVMSEYFGVFENSYVRTSQDAFIKAVNNDVNKNGLNQQAAIEKNKGLLVKSHYNYIKPEHINSFEVGYKGVFANGKVFIDADYYFNIYQDFIGQVELTKPNTGTIGTDDSTAYYAYDKTKSKVYRMWTNSTSIVSNQGSSLGITCNFYKKFTFNANVSYATLIQVADSDALIPSFNTPKWITNISLGNREIIKNIGFNITWRWQDAFDWQSPLANGKIPAYDVFDAQITYSIPVLHATCKFGASNLLNKKYYQYEGGPTIGGLYYATIVFDTNFSK